MAIKHTVILQLTKETYVISGIKRTVTLVYVSLSVCLSHSEYLPYCRFGLLVKERERRPRQLKYFNVFPLCETIL